MTDAAYPAAVLAGQPDPRIRANILTVLLTSVAYFMVALDTLVVVTALPSIHRDLGGNVGTLQWTVNAYVLAFGAGIITAAAIGDLIGRRRMYVLGLAIFTAASAGCALAPGIGALIACRAIEGVGAAIIMPLGLTLLTSAFPAERRGAVIGIWGGVAGLAVASGPLIGGAVTQGLTWHWIFWVNVPVGILAIAGSRLRLAESHGPASRLDLPALVLIAAAVGAVTWGLVQAGQVGWGSAQTLTGLSLGAASIVAFVAADCARPAHAGGRLRLDRLPGRPLLGLRQLRRPVRHRRRRDLDGHPGSDPMIEPAAGTAARPMPSPRPRMAAAARP